MSIARPLSVLPVSGVSIKGNDTVKAPHRSSGFCACVYQASFPPGQLSLAAKVWGGNSWPDITSVSALNGY